MGYSLQIYCKTRLNKILLRKDLSILKKIKKEEEDWEELEVGFPQLFRNVF